ncbi:DNRLRE domain-containing protein [Streptomyces sp. NPDC091268]|uniref:DNRLRE domain-containing protein n=1 Tax=Streptomyces sp. NPDC091268 TaxID=3365979 RepID=UPI003829A57C
MALDALTSTAAAAPQAPAAAAPVAEASGEASALLAARLNKRRIEVTGARSEHTTLWANPDGSLTQEMSSGPIRMRVGEAWVPVDTTLVETADGKVAPKAHPEGLVFSGGDAAVKVGDALAPTTPTASPSPSPSPSPSASPSPAPSRSTSPAPSPSGSASAFPSVSASVTASQTERAARSAGRVALPAVEKGAPAEQDLVKVGSGDRQVELGWLGKLPKPKLSGSTATYVDARPGVDLVLEATRTGFEQYLVVKDRTAVSQAGTLTLPLDTTGYKVERQEDGSIHLTDAAGGKPTVRIPAPSMWDAAVDSASGEHLHRAPVGMVLRGEGSDAELVFTADAGFLADAKTQFPVTIDPVVDVGTNFDTFVQSDYSTDQSSSTELKLGTYNSGGVKARSFLHFPGGDFNGKQILDAKLYLANFHSYSCTARGWEVWSAQYANTGSRWGNQPGLISRYAVSNETRDVPGDGDSHDCLGDGGTYWVKADVGNLVRDWSAMGTARTRSVSRPRTRTTPSRGSGSSRPRAPTRHSCRSPTTPCRRPRRRSKSCPPSRATRATPRPPPRSSRFSRATPMAVMWARTSTCTATARSSSGSTSRDRTAPSCRSARPTSGSPGWTRACRTRSARGCGTAGSTPAGHRAPR